MADEPDKPADPNACPYTDEELAEAGLETAIDDLVTTARNVSKDRNCGTVQKLKRAAFDYIDAVQRVVLSPEERIPDNVLADLMEAEQLAENDVPGIVH